MNSLIRVEPSGAAVKEAASLPRLAYHGGPVLGEVEVVPIYWGASWANGSDAVLATEIDSFFDFILTSSLMDMLGEYSTCATTIRNGRRLASVHLTDSEPGTVTPAGRLLRDEEVQDALMGWIAGHAAPETTANTLYFIFLPPGVTSPGYYLQPCIGGTFYGYHANVGNVYYAVASYVDSAESKFPGPPLDTFTATSSRELCAAITNPALDGWWDPANYEIGDVCDHRSGRLGGYLVQAAWSNAQSACVFKPGISFPDAD